MMNLYKSQRLDIKEDRNFKETAVAYKIYILSNGMNLKMTYAPLSRTGNYKYDYIYHKDKYTGCYLKSNSEVTHFQALKKMAELFALFTVFLIFINFWVSRFGDRMMYLWLRATIWGKLRRRSSLRHLLFNLFGVKFRKEKNKRK